MIEKRLRKFYFGIGVLGILVFVLLVIAFFYVGSPVSRRGEALDEQRMNDLSSITYRIEDYYQSYEMLPESLPRNYDGERFQDPLTGEPYGYTILDANTYELCAEFATDTTDEYADIPIQSEIRGHEAGYDCLEYSIPESIIDNHTIQDPPTFVPIR